MQLPRNLSNVLRFVALIVIGLSITVDSVYASGKKYALLIGVQTYDPQFLTRLRFAERDAREMAAALQAVGFEVTLMTGDAELPARKPTSATKILDQVKRRLTGLTKDDTLVVTFSGHGVQYKSARMLADGTTETHFFCPEEANLTKADTLVPLSQVYTLIETCPAERKLLIVDACRNEVLSEPAKSGREIELEPAGLRPRTVSKGMLALYSCTEGEKSYEWPELQHGVFCYHALKYLRGQADAKLYSQDEIGILGLAEYARRETQDYVFAKLNADQRPHLIGGTSDWAIGTRRKPNRKEVDSEAVRQIYTHFRVPYLSSVKPLPERFAPKEVYVYTIYDVLEFETAFACETATLTLNKLLAESSQLAVDHRYAIRADGFRLVKQFAEAIQAADKISVADYRNRVLVSIAVAQIRSGDAQAAQSVLKKLEGFDWSTNMPWAGDICAAYCGQGQFDRALAWYHLRSNELNNNWKSTCIGYVTSALISRGDLGRASEVASQYNCGEDLFSRVMFHIRIDNIDSAMRDARLITDYYYGPQALAHCASYYATHGQPQLASEVLSGAWALKPNYNTAYEMTKILCRNRAAKLAADVRILMQGIKRFDEHHFTIRHEPDLASMKDNPISAASVFDRAVTEMRAKGKVNTDFLADGLMLLDKTDREVRLAIILQLIEANPGNCSVVGFVSSLKESGSRNEAYTSVR